jgi:pimeloyl-ACP methyl ester carboxylesterase
METVRSKDGTTIAYDRIGHGPALILVDGALCYRASGPMEALGVELAPHFTVIRYDRRGRGDSTDSPPYRLEREIEDLDALITAAGGSAFVCGLSSGAALALEAAARGLPVRKLALYEAPFIVDNSRPPLPADFMTRLNAALAENRRGDAVGQFLKVVGVPGFGVAMMRLLPAWSKLKAVAHTLPYDLSIVGDYQQGRPLPADRWSSLRASALVLDGGKSPAWMRTATASLASVLPGARYVTLAGQTHMVKAKALAPVLTEFFAA